MLHRWPSSPARMSSSSGLRTRWDTVMGGLMPLWMQQQRRPARNAGPLTRPRRPRLAVVRWLLLDSWTLWCYTECSSLCFCILVCFVALGPAADAVERRKNPTGLVTRWGFCFTLIAALWLLSGCRLQCRKNMSLPVHRGLLVLQLFQLEILFVCHCSASFPKPSVVSGSVVTGHRGPRHLVLLLPRRRSSVKSRRRRCISLLTDVRRCGRPARRRRISWQGGRFYSLPVWQRLPCCTAAGERQRPPCPHSDKSGGEGGTLRLACCTA